MINKIINRTSKIRILIKTNLLFYILSLIVLTSLLVIIGIISSLQIDTHSKGEDIEEIYNGKKFYTIVDSFDEPEEFSEYRENPDNINKIGDFYNSLSNSSQFLFLSTFSQPIPIENFSGNDKFLYNSQEFQDVHTESPLNVKSLQINQAAFDFYKLDTREGSGFNWNDIDYDTGEIPVLLGSDYEGVYEIGDSFSGNFYSKDLRFIVTGFLESNSFIYYKGDTEFYLDQYIVFPYPKKCKLVDVSDFTFEGILYFSMINGDLASNASEKDLLYEIKQIAEKTDFIHFSVIGLPEFSLRYGEIVSVINENKNLLYISMILLLILVVFIQHGIARIILTRRIDVYKTYRLIGYYSDRKIYMRDISIPYPFAFIFANIILIICLQKVSFSALLFTLFTTLFIFIISYLSCKKLFIETTEKVM